MTTIGSRPLVRPRVATWSTIVFLILLPFLVHAVWDEIEARRLKHAIAEISSRREPTSNHVLPRLDGESGEANRLYLAASALTSDLFSENPQANILRRVTEARRTDQWPDDLVTDLRTLVGRYDDALRFADNAAPLPFAGFRYQPVFLWTGVLETEFLAGVRALLRAIDKNPDGAAASLVSEVKVQRALDWRWTDYAAIDVPTVLERIRPSSAALERLAAAWADEDPCGAMRQSFETIRAAELDQSSAIIGRWDHWDDAIARPWLAHRLNHDLRVYAALIDASAGAWPQCAERVYAEDQWPSPPFRAFDQRAARQIDLWRRGERLALRRSVRTTIAIERYRRDHEERLPDTLDALVPAYMTSLPLDPFASAPLRYRQTADGYDVYSVGHNRQDDGGRNLRPHPVVPTDWQRENYAADVGVHVAYAR